MLLSSVAETMLWTGRHIERASSLARTVQGYERLSLDLPAAHQLDLRPLLSLAGREDVAESHVSRDTPAFLRALVLDEENPSSVKGALHRARENLRQGRVVTTPKVWEMANTAYVGLSAIDGERVSTTLAMLEHLARACDCIEGEVTASMTRDAAYSFLVIGRHLERTDMLLRAMSVLLPLLGAGGTASVYADVRWLGFLKLAGAHAMYCRRHHTHVDLDTVLDFLVLDATFPRSVMYGLDVVDRELAGLPLHRAPREAVRRCSERARLLGVSTERELGPRLAESVTAIEALHDSICAAYFPLDVEASRTEPTVAREAPTNGAASDMSGLVSPGVH